MKKLHLCLDRDLPFKEVNDWVPGASKSFVMLVIQLFESFKNSSGFLPESGHLSSTSTIIKLDSSFSSLKKLFMTFMAIKNVIMRVIRINIVQFTDNNNALEDQSAPD